MKKLTVLPLCVGFILAAATSHAIDLKQSKLTQVVNDVQIISAADQKQKAASVNDIFSMPDILRTGAASRAELVAQDETVTRVGANTIFSFDPANRTIDLKQGSLLFHSPHGKGGGTIHTGSATASVLGTTLIISTTKNGGLKVLALEGIVEVRFLNGLKQKLDPGQMTFILPGANQLAPVIVFRLDELIENSLLIKGFAQTLDSLPLIQEQIDKQLKLITSGKISDTGLDVGDNAGPNQVEVLDLNTIPHGNPPPPEPKPVHIVNPPPPPPPVPNLNAAEAADATINQPSLTDVSIPTPPVHIFDIAPFSLTGNSFFGVKTFSGFVAQNIFVNTPAAGLDPLIVDLSHYSVLSAFDIVAVNNFSIEGPVTFNGLGSGEDFALIAGDQFVLTPGISIRADAHDFQISSPADLIFNNVSLDNEDLNINLNTAGDVSFQNNSVVNANGGLSVNAGNNINATDTQLTGASALFTTLNAGISFENTILNAGSHAIFLAPVSISFDNSTINADSVVLSGTATTTISINNTTINSPSSLVVNSLNDLNVTGSSPAPDNAHAIAHAPVGGSVLNTDPGTGSVTLSSVFGSVNVSGTSITAQYLTLNSGDGILLNGYGHTITATGTGATANLTASFSPNGLIDVRNADLTAYGVVNMAANTINLCYVAFKDGSVVTLRSLYGVLAPDPNTGAASVPGEVNFIQGVTYGNDPAQNHIGSGITIAGLH